MIIWMKPGDAPLSSVASFLEEILSAGPAPFIKNANVEFRVLLVDGIPLPITINKKHLAKAYVCSFYAQYIAYGKEQISTLKSRVLKCLLRGVLDCLGFAFRLGRIDKAVHINNFLVCTSLYPQLSEKQVKEINDFLLKKFPEHCLVWRSCQESSLLDRLKNLGAQTVMSRSACILDAKEKNVLRNRHLKGDINLLRTAEYEIVREDALTQKDFERLAYLHACLQQQKYSSLNSQITPEFIACGIRTGFLCVTALRKNGRFDGVYGTYTIDGMMAAPLFGYDTALTKDVGLYRQLTALSILEAKEKELVYHMSGGAASFKTRRGAIERLEYHAVIKKHLPWTRRWVWSLLALLANHVGTYVLKKLNSS